MWKSVAIVLGILCAALASGTAYLLNQVNAEQEATAAEALARRQAEARLQEMQSRLDMRNVSYESAPASAAMSDAEMARREARREERFANGGGRGFGRFEGGPRGMRMGGPGGPNGMFGLNKDMIKALKLSDADVQKLQKIFEDRIAKMRQMMEQGRGQPPDQQAMEALQKESDQQIHDALGDQKYSDYQDYRKDMQEHNRVSQLDNRLADNGQPPLSQEQSDQLFAVLKSEKGTVPQPKASNYGNRADFNTAMTDWRNAYDSRVQDRVVGILTPEQFNTYKETPRGGGNNGRGGPPPR